MHGVDVRDLEVFLGVVDHGGFRAAAEALFTSQPAISRRVRNLEATLGVPLFERGGWGTRLTGRGRSLLEAARRVDAAMLEVVRVARDGGGGVIRFGTTAGAAGYIAPFLAEWRGRHPSTVVEIVADGVISLRSRLRDGTCDVVIVAGTVGPELTALPFGTVSVIALIPADDPLGAEEGPLPISALHGRRVMMNGPLYLSSLLVRTASIAAGVQLDVVLESPVGPVLAAHAEAGLGIALFGDRTDLRAVAHLPRRPLIDAAGRPLEFPLSVCWDPARPLAEETLEFARALSAAAGHLPNHLGSRRT